MFVAYPIRMECSSGQDRDLRRLSSLRQQRHGCRADISVAEAVGSNAGKVSYEPSSGNSDKWLFERGALSDMVECTRGQMLEELLRLRDDERQRIGQELHDSAGQLILSLQLSAARLRETALISGNEDLIAEIQDVARLISQEVRSVAFLNHPIRLHRSGLATALKALIEGFGKRTGCQVHFKVIGEQPLHNGAPAMALFRVAQEALVNVHRHAHASRVSAKLERRLDRLELTIRDDGVGMPSSERLELNGGVGVQGMRFRLQQLGGCFHISNSKHGTKVSATVPLTA